VTEPAQATAQRSRPIAIDDETGLIAPDRIFIHRSARGFVCVGIGAGGALIEQAARMRTVPLLKRDPFASDDDPYLQRLIYLAKAYNPDEPRVPAGSSGGGQWTAGGIAATAASAAMNLFETDSTALVAGLGEIAARFSAPTAFLGTLFIPTNRSLISRGAVPGNAAVSFEFDRGTGVLRLTDRDSGAVLFAGRYDANGVFRDATGNAFGRVVDGAVVLDPDALPGYASSASTAQSNARTHAQTQAQTRSEPKLCPDPVGDRPSWKWMSAQALAYQAYVTGLEIGFAIRLVDPATGRPVYVDGCRESDGNLLEAKARNYRRFLDKDGNWKPWFKGLKNLINQAQRQSRAAAAIGRIVEWHVAEPEVAKALERTFRSIGIPNIVVIYDPPPVSKGRRTISTEASQYESRNFHRLLSQRRTVDLPPQAGRGDVRPLYDVD